MEIPEKIIAKGGILKNNHVSKWGYKERREDYTETIYKWDYRMT